MEDSQILVIDDEPEVLGVMVDALEAHGYSTQSTGDGREALRLLETTAFEVIVSDIMMPNLSGLQILEMAKRQNPDVQVVLVTGYSIQEVALEALSKGAAAFIEKPLKIDQLVSAVREALWRRQVKRDHRGSG